jgi:CheY-like chemotaxis protein
MIVQPSAKLQKREHPIAEQQVPLQKMSGLEGVHVLAVDDEEDSLGLLRTVLESAGARVTVASSARAALGIIASAKPDVLVADIGMPEMDGFDLIKRVRELPGPIAEVPAAALTAFARSEDRTRALQHGFEMHLAKPVDPGELVASVATLVRRSRLSRP